ncbi:glyoxalase [Paenibacillus selenitireducens]|uniref:Glyoxalase n=1 Tax=Paenibacillus selenitireducens TaxID=1324314 RepID=A0A1T2X1I3_9BACL|nr:VOC family protein [Paenibacillus selenitireducens]OPA73729.1 glyoxalase [Paenibacillus selenitireducens]
MSSPILNQVGAIFIPVQDIEQARDWYSNILGLPVEGDILHGHLYILPMLGTGVVLDSKIYAPGRTFQTPAFHFNTEHIEEAYEFMQKHQVKLLTPIEHGHWFNFEDPDGNMLMICKC